MRMMESWNYKVKLKNKQKNKGKEETEAELLGYGNQQDQKEHV